MLKKFLDWYYRKNRIVQVGDVYRIERYYGLGYWGRMSQTYETLHSAEEDVIWWQQVDNERRNPPVEKVIKTYR